MKGNASIRCRMGIIGAALRVHEELGPGMLESAYEACLMYELLEQGFGVERQKPVPVVYRGNQLDCGFRIDLLVEGLLAVEVKAIERLERVHFVQLRSHLRFSHLKLGLLINFNVAWLRDGIRPASAKLRRGLAEARRVSPRRAQADAL